MYNLAIRKCTSPPLLAPRFKFSNENLLPRRGSCWYNDYKLPALKNPRIIFLNVIGKFLHGKPDRIKQETAHSRSTKHHSTFFQRSPKRKPPILINSAPATLHPHISANTIRELNSRPLVAAFSNFFIPPGTPGTRFY